MGWYGGRQVAMRIHLQLHLQLIYNYTCNSSSSLQPEAMNPNACEALSLPTAHDYCALL